MFCKYLQSALPGTYTTTISGQCSARGHCPPAARLRRWRQGNVKRKTPDALVSTRDRRSIQVHKKNLAPKGLSILRRYFAIYFFKKQAYTSNCYA